jgi:hypothetical protein
VPIARRGPEDGTGNLAIPASMLRIAREGRCD